MFKWANGLYTSSCESGFNQHGNKLVTSHLPNNSNKLDTSGPQKTQWDTAVPLPGVTSCTRWVRTSSPSPCGYFLSSVPRQETAEQQEGWQGCPDRSPARTGSNSPKLILTLELNESINLLLTWRRLPVMPICFSLPSFTFKDWFIKYDIQTFAYSILFAAAFY